MRRLLALLLLLGAASPSGAQVERVQNAFQLARFSEDRSGQYDYQYLLHGPREGGGVAYTDVFVDVTSPRTLAPPRMLGASGNFLFDGISRNYRDLPYSHPDLFMGIPPNFWMGSVYLQGSAAWGATRYGDGRNYGVTAGNQLLGFELRSPALPALRRYRVVPYRHTPGADAVDGAQTPVKTDSGWVIAAGVVLAPGWMAEDVTTEYFDMQVGVACEAYLLESCGKYLRYGDAIRSAEATQSDAAYESYVQQARQYVAGDTKSDRTARYALDMALQALRRRPPSRRAPVRPTPAPAR